jgi:hypothetical protein
MMTRKRYPWTADRERRTIRFALLGVVIVLVLAFTAAILVGVVEDIPTNVMWFSITIVSGAIVAGLSNTKEQGRERDRDRADRNDRDGRAGRCV